MGCDWTKTMRESISDPTAEPVKPTMNAVTRHLVDAIRTVDMVHQPGDDMLPRARATAIKSLWDIINRTEDSGQITLAHREVASIVVNAVGWLRENE
jgi:hypothetical protein